MKKLITILTIMIVLVGAVFATTTTNAYIDINVGIEELVPNFSLSTTAYGGATDVAGSDDTHASIAKGSTGALSTALLTADSADSARTVAFSINQTSVARLSTGTVFTLTVTASDLILLETTTSGEGENQTTTTAPKASPGKNEYFACSTKTPAITKHADITATINGSSVTLADFEAGATDNVMTITYGGYVAATDAIGTFDVIWAANQYAVNGDYQATVELEVVAP